MTQSSRRIRNPTNSKARQNLPRCRTNTPKTFPISLVRDEQLKTIWWKKSTISSQSRNQKKKNETFYIKFAILFSTKTHLVQISKMKEYPTNECTRNLIIATSRTYRIKILYKFDRSIFHYDLFFAFSNRSLKMLPFNSGYDLVLCIREESLTAYIRSLGFFEPPPPLPLLLFHTHDEYLCTRRGTP